MYYIVWLNWKENFISIMFEYNFCHVLKLNYYFHLNNNFLALLWRGLIYYVMRKQNKYKTTACIWPSQNLFYTIWPPNQFPGRKNTVLLSYADFWKYNKFKIWIWKFQCKFWQKFFWTIFICAVFGKFTFCIVFMKIYFMPLVF